MDPIAAREAVIQVAEHRNRTADPDQHRTSDNPLTNQKGVRRL